MARTLITDDDVDALGIGGATREAVDLLLSWVRDTERFRLADDLPADYPLGLAAEYLIDLGEFDEAWSVSREMDAHPRAAPLAGHLVRIRACLVQGRRDEARAVADGMRRDPRLGDDPMLIEQVTELFELEEMWSDALRWTSIGLRMLEAAGWDDTEQYHVMLTTRFRIRRAADLPWDLTDRADLRSQEIFRVDLPD